MPVQISVGPPLLIINQGKTVMVTEPTGEMRSEKDCGVYASDTRYLSHLAWFANGRPWIRLTSSPIAFFAARIYLMNPELLTEDGNVPEGSIGLSIWRAIDEGIHEDLDITNYGLQPVRFNFEVSLRSDFADLFEVRTRALVRRGRIVTRWHAHSSRLDTTYDHGDFHRRFTYEIHRNDSPAHYANGRITFEVTLAPGATWHTCAYYILSDKKHERAPKALCRTLEASKVVELQDRWIDSCARLTTVNEDVYRLFDQSLEDMGALRLADQEREPKAFLPAAGVPWYVTLFGRDSLITSHQNMLVYPPFARATLNALAEQQAKDVDDWRDAQPGKILHEMRFGELAHFNKIPHTPYYGTADATILYLIVLHEAWRWIGDLELCRGLRDTALRCLEWIDRFGDLDQDGFQEYRTRSERGYENQGWKDSAESVMYPDGSPVKQPKALCELQGYVYDAWLRMAEVFDALDEADRSAALRDKAAALYDRFNDRFWCEDLGTYAYGLDPEKRLIKTVVSNAGHCLWSGIVPPERAARVVKRLMEPDMWSGWGIRTLSADHPSYNPHSYHNGSVWPHDNGIIALGFKRYGFAAEAARVARDISEAASCFVSYRLPELYAGLPREPTDLPVQYRGANVPQAWTSGSVFHLLQAILGLQADAPRGRLYVDPALPDWLTDLTLNRIKVGEARVDLRFWREGKLTRWDVLGCDGELRVDARPWGTRDAAPTRSGTR
jgi:glycogen debranching enzyme